MPFPLSLPDTLLVFAISFFGATLQGSVGFGLGLVTAPILILIDPHLVPGPLIFSALLLNLLVSYRERRSFELRSAKWVFIGRTLGTVIAAGVLAIIPREGLSLILGTVILAAVFMSLGGFRLHLSRRNLFGAGALSGFMATTSAVGGPPLALIYQHMKGTRLRSMLAGIFVYGAILALLSLAAVGRFGLREILLGGVMMPGIVAGFALSGKTARLLDRGFVRPAVLAVSALSGIVVILKYLL